jgi:GxxExxY protein
MFAPIPERADAAAKRCVEAALRVHRRLGPGLLESVYQHCLAYELLKAKAPVAKQVLLPVEYDGIMLDAGYRVDLIVDESVIVQVKSVETLSPIHDAQVLTYLKLSRLRVGLLINFNVALLKQGLRRFVL